MTRMHRSADVRTVDVPLGYRLHMTLDLRDDRRAAVTIQVSFAVVVAVMVAAALVLDLPLDGPLGPVVTTVLTIGACLAYMALHELTHALLLWMLTHERPSIAVRLPYLVTGSRALLTRATAVVVALAPLAFFTPVLLVLLGALPSRYFLTAYVVLGLNLASSAGDVFQAQAFLRLPGPALIRDDGKQTSVYLPTGRPQQEAREPGAIGQDQEREVRRKR